MHHSAGRAAGRCSTIYALSKCARSGRKASDEFAVPSAAAIIATCTDMAMKRLGSIEPPSSHRIAHDSAFQTTRTPIGSHKVMTSLTTYIDEIAVFDHQCGLSWLSGSSRPLATMVIQIGGHSRAIRQNKPRDSVRRDIWAIHNSLRSSTHPGELGTAGKMAATTDQTGSLRVGPSNGGTRSLYG